MVPTKPCATATMAPTRSSSSKKKTSKSHDHQHQDHQLRNQMAQLVDAINKYKDNLDT
jgi:hypothetical protein